MRLRRYELVREHWNMETQPLTIRLKGDNAQITEYPWFQLYVTLSRQFPDTSHWILGESCECLTACEDIGLTKASIMLHGHFTYDY
jgi:hypothetical protein